MERPKTSSPVNSGFNGEMMMTNHQNEIKNNIYIYNIRMSIIHQTVAVMNFFFMKYDKYDDQVA